NALQWDSVPRVDSWLTTHGGAEDSPYVRAVSALVLIAAVRRIRRPGCKFDEMVVLQSSSQGVNKSSALCALCVDPEWFSDSIRLSASPKEIIEQTLGKW